MLTILAFLFIALSIFAHEYGHFVAMRRHGIKVKEMGLGLRVPRLTLRIQHPKFLEGVPFYLSPLIIMASVVPERMSDVDKLPTSARLEIYGNGALMNLVFMWFALVIVCTQVPNAIFYACAGLLTLMMGKLLCRYIFPIISFCSIFLIPSVMLATWEVATEGGSGTSEALTSAATSLVDWRQAIGVSAILSFVLGAINLIGLYPLDGGRIVDTLVAKWFKGKLVTGFRVITGLMTFLIILVCSIDIVLASVRIMWDFISK